MKKSKNEQTAELTPKKRKKRRSKKIKTTIAIIFLIAGCAFLFSLNFTGICSPDGKRR